jgi:hypothetical protein
LTAFFFFTFVYFRYPLMYGIDGPYYIIQERALLQEGWIKYPDPPLAFFMLAPFYALGEVVGLKLGIVLFMAITSLMLYFTFFHFGRDLAVASLASLSFIFSSYTLRMAGDLIKNAIGLLFISSFILALYTIRSRKLRLFVMLSSILACGLTHVLDFGVLSLIIALSLLFYIITKREKISDLVYSALFIGLLLTLTLLFPVVVGGDIYKLFSFLGSNLGDVERLRPPLTIRMPFTYAVAIAGLAYSFMRKEKLAPLAFSASILLIGLNFPLIEGKWLWRFELMNSILLPLVLPLFITGLKENWRKTLILILILGVMLSSVISILPMLRPSLPLQAVEEIRELKNIIDEKANLVVKNTRLRYWVEAELGESYQVTTKPVQNTFYVVHEVKGPPLPGKPIFSGSFISVKKVSRPP